MYCTIDDIKKRRINEQSLIQLTDDDNQGVVATSVVDDAIASAQALIDGYLRKRYTLPLASVPEEIKSIAIVIAAYELYGHRPHFETPERIENDYKNALSQLDKIATGRLVLDAVDNTGQTSSASEDLPAVGAPDQKFSDDALENY